MISICRYTQDKHTQWDDFVKVSKNGTFLFLRAYMDYHSDRFHDHSLMFHNEKGKLIAVLPANIRTASPPALHSHQGLTYGGYFQPTANTQHLTPSTPTKALPTAALCYLQRYTSQRLGNYSD